MRYSSLLDRHYEITRKLTAIEHGDGNEPAAKTKCADLRGQLEQVEVELTKLHEEFEPEDFHHVLRNME